MSVLLLTVGLTLGISVVAPRSVASAPAPIASMTQARALVDGGAVVLDVRGRSEYRAGHLKGAVRIDWQDYRDGWGRTGRLADDDARLARTLGELGLDDARAVLVYGKTTAGFGEEGRIAWMLRYLGHDQVQLLDGGWEAWRRAGGPVETGGGSAQPRGRLSIHRRPELRVELAEVQRLLGDRAGVVLDVRTEAEWDGARPYFEARGGHLPGARHLPWTAFFDPSGAQRDPRELASLLAARGLRRDLPVVVYCTGGVRSALVWAVLAGLGYPVRNFDASFWAWAARKDLPVEVGGAP